MHSISKNNGYNNYSGYFNLILTSIFPDLIHCIKKMFHLYTLAKTGITSCIRLHYQTHLFINATVNVNYSKVSGQC